jgi:diguanylate cyclase (GGDEF)-like protein
MFTLQRGALMREMETAATTDAKTGLLNAVAWEHLADRELARARRDRYALSVLIIDIDRFKRVNDQYGHLVGDQVLRRIGKTISAEVREYDGVGRFGGEEFVVLLPEVDAVESMVIAERIRSRINRLRVSDLVEGMAADADDRLSVSIGVTSSVFGAEDVADLLREADTALYRAKAEGRNRVLLAGTGGFGMPTLLDGAR